jgi:hypothetical protein
MDTAVPTVDNDRARPDQKVLALASLDPTRRLVGEGPSEAMLVEVDDRDLVAAVTRPGIGLGDEPVAISLA